MKYEGDASTPCTGTGESGLLESRNVVRQNTWHENSKRPVEKGAAGVGNGVCGKGAAEWKNISLHTRPLKRFWTRSRLESEDWGTLAVTAILGLVCLQWNRTHCQFWVFICILLKIKSSKLKRPFSIVWRGRGNWPFQASGVTQNTDHSSAPGAVQWSDHFPASKAVQGSDSFPFHAVVQGADHLSAFGTAQWTDHSPTSGAVHWTDHFQPLEQPNEPIIFQHLKRYKGPTISQYLEQHNEPTIFLHLEQYKGPNVFQYLEQHIKRPFSSSQSGRMNRPFSCIWIVPLQILEN